MPERDPQFLCVSPDEPGTSIPLPYEVWADGVYRKGATKDKSAAPSNVEPDIDAPLPWRLRANAEQVALKPVWVCDLGLALDSGERIVELAFRPDPQTTERLWCGLADIADTRRLITLSSGGVPVSSETARAVVSYLTRCERLLGGVRQPSLVGTRTGWIEQGGRLGFLLGTDWYGPGRVSCDPRRSNERFVTAFAPAGDSEMWLSWLRRVYDESWIARFVLAATFSAPLLFLLGERSFYVHQWGASTRGKTALTKFAMSAWGQPGTLTSTFHRTENSVTEVYRHMTDVPVAIDELQVAKDVDAGRIIHAVCTERAKERAARTGGLRLDQGTWKTVVLTTGERPLVERDLGGQTARGLQINSPIFTSLRDGAPLYRVVQEHWGHGGRMLVRHLAGQLAANADYTARLRDAHARIATHLRTSTGRSENHAKVVATIVLGGWLMAEVILGKRGERNRLLDDATRALAEGTPDVAETVVSRALEALRQHRLASGASWIDGRLTTAEARRRMTSSHNLVGIVATHGGEAEVWLVPQTASRVLEQAGLESSRVWADLDAQGLLVCDPGHKTARRMFGTTRIRVYAVRYATMFPPASEAEQREATGESESPRLRLVPPSPDGA